MPVHDIGDKQYKAIRAVAARLSWPPWPPHTDTDHPVIMTDAAHDVLGDSAVP